MLGKIILTGIEVVIIFLQKNLRTHTQEKNIKQKARKTIMGKENWTGRKGDTGNLYTFYSSWL